MSLLTALRQGVSVANKVTKPIQGTVMFLHCIGSDAYGPIFASAVPLRAIIDQKQQQVRTKSGVLSASRCQITFLDVNAIIAATPGDGRIKDTDVIRLPDNSQGPIIAEGGFVDALTGNPVATDVWL